MLVGPGERFILPATFNFPEYLDAEDELRMLFPELGDRRANFHQLGLTIVLYAESQSEGNMEENETYFLMPDHDGEHSYMRPIRMAAVRRLDVSEYRMAQLTAAKLIGRMPDVAAVFQHIGERILGEELLEEMSARLNGQDAV